MTAATSHGMAIDRTVAQGLELLADGHRILWLEGHGDMSLCHLSWRDPHGRGFWLKRGHIGLEEVTADDFLLLGFDGEILSGRGVRHLEWPIHAEIFRRRPDVEAAGHSHPFHATVFSCTTETLRPLTNEGAWFEAPPGRFDRTSGLVDTVELGAALAHSLGEGRAVFLRNHGAVYVGRNVQEMCLTGVFLDKACRVQLALAQSGLDHGWPDEAEIARKRASIYFDEAIENFWRYYRRRLAAEGPQR